MKDNEKKNLHDSTKLVEHIQFVHFSLVVIAMAMFAILSIDQHDKTSAATTQAKEVKKILDFWDENLLTRSFDAKVAAKTQYTSFFLPRGVPYRTPISIKGENVTFEFSTDRVFITEDEKLKELLKKYNEVPKDANQQFEIISLKVDKPNNLTEFIAFWNAFNKPSYAYAFLLLPDKEDASKNEDYAFVQKGSASYKKLPWDFNCDRCTSEQKSDYTLRPQKISDSERPIFVEVNGKFDYEFINPEGQNHRIRVPVASEKIDFDAHQILIEFCNEKNMKLDWNSKKAFEEIAPELNELGTKNGLDQIPITNLLTILQAESERSREKLSAFGITIPAEGLRRWGSLVLVLVQLYFCLHILMLSKRISNEDPGLLTPWIGMYPIHFTAFITLVSSTLLPLFSVVWAIITSPDFFKAITGSSLFDAALIIISLVLSVVTGLTYFRFWEMIKAFSGADVSNVEVIFKD